MKHTGRQLPPPGAATPEIEIGAPSVTADDGGRRPSLESAVSPALSSETAIADRHATALPVTCATCGGLAGERVTYTTGRYEMVCACGNIQSVIWPAEGEPEGIDE